jgi:hypothetical protein
MSVSKTNTISKNIKNRKKEKKNNERVVASSFFRPDRYAIEHEGGSRNNNVKNN